MGRSVLVVGGGAREHAIAWKLCASPSVARVLVCPGNGGIDALAVASGGVDVGRVTDVAMTPQALVALARSRAVDLTIIGPEAPLAEGVVDAFDEAGLPCFGPTKAAAQLEASKAFSKSFMARHDIPTARFSTFTDFAAAQRYLLEVGAPVVVKASGLAAGKGVVVCETLDQALSALSEIMRDGRFGEAGSEVVIEERLIGQELSVMAFTDGHALAVMPAAQDHKAVYEGERGPNTGGMGAYAPVPIATAPLLAEIEERVLRRAITGLAAEGRPYRGVIYAGIMLTDEGIRVLEFNCRLGDPEAEVVLPLLEGDLAEICLACVEGRLATVDAGWRSGAAATVVAASAGYPGRYEKGRRIRGVEAARGHALVFHAGTAHRNGELWTDGGRVLAVTGVADDLQDALSAAYRGIDAIAFTGMHVRRDIGHRALASKKAHGVSYRDAGVDIDAGNRAVALMRASVQSTFGPRVLSGVGAFGGLYDASWLKELEAPVLVSSTDGVGTKTKVAAALGRWGTIGADLVNHCINDILVQGARPLFFLDYVASSQVAPDVIAEVVEGCARACRQAQIALIGGETAEMPGVYLDGELDLAGTIVGVVERGRIIDGSGICPGDVVLALPSSGLHTNGYSLARRVFASDDLETTPPGLDEPLGRALLATHRSYLPALDALEGAGLWPRGLVHVTGGGLIDNPPRVLPPGACLAFDPHSWSVPPLFRLIQARGGVDDQEMRRVFNLGLGLLVIVGPAEAAAAQAALGAEVMRVGTIVERTPEGPQVTF